MKELSKLEQDLLNGRQYFTERELSNLTDYEQEREEGDDRRWSKSITSYIKVLDRWFSIDWEQGLTEMQDNEYTNQPEEVIREEKQVITTQVTWKTIKK